ncbi:MAG TPA: poly-gamma-glutamate biosynthesis protein PgsC/CapC [Anaerolineales bacterium]|nr:poly-gamma-glutamate biosynthesis protein PgsC/CapC [Anaerolineales bacterium]
MYDYYVSNELARLTIILGIVVSTIIYKRTGLTLGGVIVCGYLALFVGQPSHIVITLVISYITFQIVYKVLQKRYMLNGRKLFEVEILVGLVLQVFWLTIIKIIGMNNIDLTVLYGIGFVLPGVIAHDMGRQGAKNTVGSILLGVFIISLVIFPLSAIEELLPNFLLRTSSPLLRTQPYPYAYPIQLLPFGIIASVFIDLLAYSKFKARSGGFVTAAYLALFAQRPFDLLFVIIASILTFLFVQFLTSRLLLAFGRTKLGMMILSGVVISWLLEIMVINLTGGLVIPWSGFVIIMPTIASLIANDFAREGTYPTVITTSLASAGVWLVMQGMLFVLSLTHLDWFFIA